MDAKLSRVTHGMTPQQFTAIRNPCTNEQMIADPIYCRTSGRMHVIVILTFKIDEVGTPCFWEAAVMFSNEACDGFEPYENWTRQQRRHAKEIVIRALFGVGIREVDNDANLVPDLTRELDKCVQILRNCTDMELAYVAERMGERAKALKKNLSNEDAVRAEVALGEKENVQ